MLLLLLCYCYEYGYCYCHDLRRILPINDIAHACSFKCTALMPWSSRCTERVSCRSRHPMRKLLAPHLKRQQLVGLSMSSQLVWTNFTPELAGRHCRRHSPDWGILTGHHWGRHLWHHWGPPLCSGHFTISASSVPEQSKYIICIQICVMQSIFVTILSDMY